MPSEDLSQLRYLEAIAETLLKTIRGLIAARESEARHRRGGLFTVASLPVAAAAIGLARKWPHVSSAIGGAVVTGGAVAFVLVPQIGNGSAPAAPDSDVDKPPISAPARVAPPPHTRSRKSSPPSRRTYIVGPPASTPTVISSQPITPGRIHGKKPGHGHHPKPPGKPVDPPGKPTKCRGGLLGLLGLLCDHR